MNIKMLFVWIAAFLVAWTGIDYVYSTFITKEGFVFAPGSNLIIPVVAGIVVWVLIEKNKSK